MAIIESDTEVRTPFEQDVAATQRYFDDPRFAGLSASTRPVKWQSNVAPIPFDYTIAREAAEASYPHLRELFAQRRASPHSVPTRPGRP